MDNQSQPFPEHSPFQPHVKSSPTLNPPVSSALLSSPTKKSVSNGTENYTVELKDLIKANKLKEVKSFIRDHDWPPNHPIRSELWAELCHQNHSSSEVNEGFYWETVDQVFGRNQLLLTCMWSPTLGQFVKGTKESAEECASLPSFVDQDHLLNYSLTEKGRLAVRRVVCIIGYTHPDITYCPGLYGLTSLFLHYMSEEKAYNCICALIKSPHGRYLHQTKLGYEAAWRTVHALSKKHAKNAIATLTKLVKYPDQVERLFEGWYWWMFSYLPINHLVRVVDCFLFEGKKVLYRVAMALIILFTKAVAKGDATLTQEVQRSGIASAFRKFCREINIPPHKLLKTAFGIRGFSQKTISSIVLRIEMGLKSKTTVSGPNVIVRSFSSEGLPTSQSQINIHTTSHTLTIRELFTLWSWLPARITMYQPQLIYTTEEHGCSLMTFYTRVQDYEPTLLIIKTTTDEIFGAYCSTKWAERNIKGDSGVRQTYFGTGETFIFTLTPEIKKYSWVGLCQSGVGAEVNPPAKHSSELFMAGDNRMITIGGGNGQAIWIDENIRFGGTGPCDTFANSSLCMNFDFECKVVEVIGFV
ncbi:hypothetical protein CHUAL_009090 [Chamberlinius hualienensis]